MPQQRRRKGPRRTHRLPRDYTTGGGDGCESMVDAAELTMSHPLPSQDHPNHLHPSQRSEIHPSQRSEIQQFLFQNRHTDHELPIPTLPRRSTTTQTTSPTWHPALLSSRPPHLTRRPRPHANLTTQASPSMTTRLTRPQHGAKQPKSNVIEHCPFRIFQLYTPKLSQTNIPRHFSRPQTTTDHLTQAMLTPAHRRRSYP